MPFIWNEVAFSGNRLIYFLLEVVVIFVLYNKYEVISILIINRFNTKEENNYG